VNAGDRAQATGSGAVRTASTLVLSRATIAARVAPLAYVAAVRRAFLALADARVDVPPVAHVPGFGGGIHLKSARGLDAPRRIAIKLNANFPDNPARLGLPTIQGVIALFDADCGRLLALMDSVEVTAQRTAAATAVAASCLARPDARRLALIGCGIQARYHLDTLRATMPIVSVSCQDLDPDAAHMLAAYARSLGLDASVARTPAEAARAADIVVTCTPSQAPLLDVGDVRAGSFVAGVGADAPHKHELAPGLLRVARVVPDVLAQAVHMGDLHHALAAGAMRIEEVHGDLATVLAGRCPGRTDDEQVFVFDSTGVAITDLAAAELIHELLHDDPQALRLDLAC